MIVPKVGRKKRRLASTEAFIATETATASIATYIIVSQQSHKVFLAYGQEQMVLFEF